MPTTISGTTGVSQIQDGTVATADIADDAITDAKIAAVAATKLTGTIADARFPATLPAASAANLTSIPAANITGTLPAISATNLTSIPAANITGTLPAISGANLTGITTGKVLQIVTGTVSSFTTTSTGWVDTGLSATITPASTSSKILIQYNAGGINRPGAGGECGRHVIARGSTHIYGGGNLFYTTDSFSYSGVSVSLDYLDSPSTTSATTYKIRMQTRLGGSCTMSGGSAAGQAAILILTEIA